MSLSFILPAVKQGSSVPLDDVEWIKINQTQRRIDFYGARLAGHQYTVGYLDTQDEIYQKDLLEISQRLTANNRSWLAFKAGPRLTAVNVAQLLLLIHWKPQRQIYFNARICTPFSIHEDNGKLHQMYETIKNRFSHYHESHCIEVDTPNKEFCFCPNSCSEIEVDEAQRSMKYSSPIFQNGFWSGRESTQICLSKIFAKLRNSVYLVIGSLKVPTQRTAPFAFTKILIFQSPKAEFPRIGLSINGLSLKII